MWVAVCLDKSPTRGVEICSLRTDFSPLASLEMPSIGKKSSVSRLSFIKPLPRQCRCISRVQASIIPPQLLMVSLFFQFIIRDDFKARNRTTQKILIVHKQGNTAVNRRCRNPTIT
jgi:hypothetical protein